MERDTEASVVSLPGELAGEEQDGSCHPGDDPLTAVWPAAASPWLTAALLLSCLS